MNREGFLESSKDLTKFSYDNNTDGLQGDILTRTRTLVSVLDNNLIQGYTYRMNDGTLLDLLKLAVDIDLSQDIYGTDIMPIMIIDESNRKFVDNIIFHNTNVELSKKYEDFTEINFNACVYPVIIAYNIKPLSEILKDIESSLDFDLGNENDIYLFIDELTHTMFSDSITLYKSGITIVCLKDSGDISYDVKATLFNHNFDIKEK